MPATYFILYSAEKLREEAEAVPQGAEWGIVAIIGTMEPTERPMDPITMMRNALGI